MLKLIQKIAVIMVVIALLFCVTVNVQATNSMTIPGLDTMPDANETTEPTNETALPEVNETETNEQIVQPTTNTTGSSYTNSDTLPQTGVTEDITIMFFIVVCIISAVYAYRKIKNYNG